VRVCPLGNTERGSIATLSRRCGDRVAARGARRNSREGFGVSAICRPGPVSAPPTTLQVRSPPLLSRTSCLRHPQCRCSPWVSRAPLLPGSPIRSIQLLVHGMGFSLDHRTLAVRTRLGQQFVIDNRAGWRRQHRPPRRSLRARPADGYTLLLVGGFQHAVNATFYASSTTISNQHTSLYRNLLRSHDCLPRQSLATKANH